MARNINQEQRDKNQWTDEEKMAAIVVGGVIGAGIGAGIGLILASKVYNTLAPEESSPTMMEVLETVYDMPKFSPLEQNFSTEVDETLTARNIAHALDGLGPYWQEIGKSLKLSEDKLTKTADQFSDNDRRLLEVILEWLLRNKHCSWKTIKEAVCQINMPEYSMIIDIHKTDLKRILAKFKSGPHYRTKKPRFDTCYEEWWLDQIEFEPDPLKQKIDEERDFRHIVKVVTNCVPIEWYRIGTELRIPQSMLQIIEADERTTDRKAIKMLSTWIANDEESTWQVLIDALQTLKFDAAVIAMTEIAPKKIMKKKCDMDAESSTRKNKKNKTSITNEKQKSNDTKKLLFKKLRSLLQVDEHITDDELIISLADHLNRANFLNRDHLKEVIRTLESLEKEMSTHSGTLRKWSDDLKKDKDDAWNVMTQLKDRNDKLTELQSDIARKRTAIVEQLQKVQKAPNYYLMSARTLQLHQHRIEMENILMIIRNEIQNAIEELNRAHADFVAISKQLNQCQIELKECVKDFEIFQKSMIASKPKVNLLAITLAGAALGGSVGAGVGVGAGLAAGPLGAIAGAGVLGIVGAWFGGKGAYYLGTVYNAKKSDEYKDCETMINSCIDAINENRKEISKITHTLNSMEHPW